MIACVFPALFSYSLAREFSSPPQPGCLLQSACPPLSISPCSKEGCHTNQCQAFCTQREHGWHSNWLKQPGPQLFGEPWWSLPEKVWSRNRGSSWAAVSRHCPVCNGHGQPCTAMAMGSYLSKDRCWLFFLHVPLPTTNSSYHGFGVFSHPNIKFLQIF